MIPALAYAQLAPAPATKTAQAKVKKKKTQEVKPSISFKPDSLIKEYEKGTTVTEKIIVQNNIDLEYQAEVVIVPMYANSSGVVLREDQLPKNKNDKSFRKLPFLEGNILISEKIITLKPKQVTTVPVTFKIPADAKGTFYFQYSIQPLKKEFIKMKSELLRKKEIKGAQVMVALNVYSMGAIKIKDQAEISVDAENRIKYIPQSKQVLIQSTLKNKGTDFALKYEGTAVVLKGGQVVSKFDIKPTQNLTLFVPDTSRTFAGSAEASLVKGEYDVVITFKDKKGEKLSTFKEKLKVN